MVYFSMIKQGIKITRKCPFCGANAELEKFVESDYGWDDLITWAVVCSICSVKTAEYRSKKDAILFWESKDKKTLIELSKKFNKENTEDKD